MADLIKLAEQLAAAEQFYNCLAMANVPRDPGERAKLDLNYRLAQNRLALARAAYEAALDDPANEYVRDHGQFGVGA